jgi:general secretion pathway protein D
MKKSFKNLPIKLALPTFLFAGLLGAPMAYAQNNTFNPGTSAISPITQSVETGPILDVVPYVLSDGYTINLALIPSDTEFGGYDTLALPQVAGNLNVVQLPTVLPRFTVRQVVTTVNVWDNQTVVLGGLITSTVNSTKDKVPVIGDLPLFGRFFQSQSKQTVKNNLMIFVTATIVDPAGSRVHSDDELPFAQNTVPTQPAANVAPVEKVQNVVGLP